MNTGSIHFPNIFFLFSIREALKIGFLQKHFYEIIAIKYLDFWYFDLYLFYLLFPLIPYISVEAMVVYFFSIIVQFNDGKQGYLGQYSDYENTFFVFKMLSMIIYELLSLKKWIKLSKYEPNIN